LVFGDFGVRNIKKRRSRSGIGEKNKKKALTGGGAAV